MARKKMTDEERKRKKRECEKRRRQKIKNNPQRYKLEQQQKHERYEKGKDKGIVRLKKDLSRRELKAKRGKWRENSKRYRNKKTFNKNLVSNTPPDSEQEELDMALPNLNPNVNGNNSGRSTTVVAPGVSFKTTQNSTPTIDIPSKTIQHQRGRKNVKRNRSKTVRDLNKIRSENKKLRTKLEFYKKKWFRVLEKKKNEVLSPNSKVNKLLNGSPKVPPAVRKKLLFGEVLNKELTSKFQTLKDQKSKQVFSKVIEGRYLKKYRLLKEAKHFYSPTLHRSNKKRSDRLMFERRSIGTFGTIKKSVILFYLQDENSRLCPGKKDTITRRGIKKQKRYLNNTQKILFDDFKKQHPDFQISYATFCKLRPFWVVQPAMSGRDTCLCILHENVNLLVSSLSRNRLIRERNIDQIVSKLCCSKQNEKCLGQNCENCKENKMLYYVSEDMWNQNFNYEQWITKKEKREHAKTKKEILVQRTVKEKIAVKPEKLIHELNTFIPKMLRHILNISHQFSVIKQLKADLGQHEIFIHVDFSENYSCKYAKEAQSVHFGASREQITLHTGMMYSQSKKQGFCTISKSMRHDPSAIIAHLQPVLNHYLEEMNSETITIHFLSDSPSTQYRNKKLFYFLQNVIPKLYPNVKYISWNYTESGHGKGAPDGIGATIKRTADRLVTFDQDINTFDVFVRAIKDNIKTLYLDVVDEQDIEKFDTYLPTVRKPLKGTMQAHQATWTKEDGTLFLNKLSCFQCNFLECSHFKITKMLPKSNPENLMYNRGTSTSLQSSKSNAKNLMNNSMTYPSSQSPNYQENDWITAIYDNEWYPGNFFFEYSNTFFFYFCFIILYYTYIFKFQPRS